MSARKLAASLLVVCLHAAGVCADPAPPTAVIDDSAPPTAVIDDSAPPVQLPDFAVSDNMPFTSLPYDQVREMRSTVRERYKTFALESYAVQRYLNSLATPAVKSLIRDAEGRIVADITTEGGVYEVEDKYAGLFISSNQPSEHSGIFFLLRIQRDRDDITLGFLDELFEEYRDFVTQRLELVQRHYQAKKKDEFKELIRLMVPDEVVIVAASEDAAGTIAAKLATKADGRGIRLSPLQLKELAARLGRDFRLCDDPAAIDCLTPWRHEEVLPTGKINCALIAIGWATYRERFFSPYRYEVIVPAMVSPK